MGNLMMRWNRLYVNGYNLSGDSRTVASLGESNEGVDMTAWDRQIREYAANRNTAPQIRGYQAFLNDTAVTGAHTLLKNNPACIVSLLFGDMAEPVAGDAAYILSGGQFKDNAVFDAGAALLQADFIGSTTDDTAWGVVLYPATSINATTNGSSINNGAATAAGWNANLHITATASGNFAFKIEHSTNNSTWTTLGTFTINGSAITAEHISGTGAVNQYVRFVATRTAGTITPVCTFVRN